MAAVAWNPKPRGSVGRVTDPDPEVTDPEVSLTTLELERQCALQSLFWHETQAKELTDKLLDLDIQIEAEKLKELKTWRSQLRKCARDECGFLEWGGTPETRDEVGLWNGFCCFRCTEPENRKKHGRRCAMIDCQTLLDPYTDLV